MAKTFLTIGVPTYNRPTELLNCVRSLVGQSGLGSIDSLEIIISDNCSDENSFEVLHDFLDIPNLTIYRSEINVGYDRNINNIFEKAQGEFVIILADDDRLKEGSLNRIWKTINESKSDIILFETDFFDSELLYRIPIEEDFFKWIGHTKTFLRGQFLLQDLNVELFGGVTGFCMRRSLWFAAKPKRFFDSNWIHLGVLLSAISNNSITVVREKYFDYRMENKERRWQELYVTLGIASIYSNSGLLDYVCCRIAYEKYRKEFLIKILMNQFSLSNFTRVVSGSYRLHRNRFGHQFLLDLAIISSAIVFPKKLINLLLRWRLP